MHHNLKKQRQLPILKILCKIHRYFDIFTEVGVYWKTDMSKVWLLGKKCRKYMNDARPSAN